MPLNIEKVKWVSGAMGAGKAAVTGAGALRRTVDSGAGAANADERFAAWVLGPAARVPKVSMRAGLQGVLFDLDGVLVDTAEFHYLAWKRLAEELGVPFDRRMNDGFRGVGRMDCLEKLLGAHRHVFASQEKDVLAGRKNSYYVEMVRGLTPGAVLPGVWELITGLRGLEGGVRLGVVSASKNARMVLGLLGMGEVFDVVIDGTAVTRGKPDPQGFLLAAERLRVRPERCVVIEDAEAGIKAGQAAGMRTIGVGVGGDVRVGRVGEVSCARVEGMVGVEGYELKDKR